MYLTMNKDNHLLVLFAMLQNAYTFVSKSPHGSLNSSGKVLMTQSRDHLVT